MVFVFMLSAMLDDVNCDLLCAMRWTIFGNFGSVHRIFSYSRTKNWPKITFKGLWGTLNEAPTRQIHPHTSPAVGGLNLTGRSLCDASQLDFG